MPTPVVHLYLAQEILQSGAAGYLNGCVSDYLLGSIAPDAWSIAGVTRRQAHILPIPIPAGKRVVEELLTLYPHLRAAIIRASRKRAQRMSSFSFSSVTRTSTTGS